MKEIKQRKTRENRKSIPLGTLNNLIKSAEEAAKRGTERMDILRSTNNGN